MPRCTARRREKRKTETVTETGTKISGRKGRNEEGKGERSGGRERGGSGGRGENRRTVSQECVNIRDGLRVGRCQLDSAPTTSVTDVKVD